MLVEHNSPDENREPPLSALASDAPAVGADADRRTRAGQTHTSRQKAMPDVTVKNEEGKPSLVARDGSSGNNPACMAGVSNIR
jgi:hypothetical protein